MSNTDENNECLPYNYNNFWYTYSNYRLLKVGFIFQPYLFGTTVWPRETFEPWKSLI